MSYGRLEDKCVFLERRDGKSYVVQQKSGVRVFEVHRRHNVLRIDTMRDATRDARINAVTNPLKEASELLDDTMTETTLLELHKSLGHISYDTVERMADAAGSGVRLKSRARLNCLTCAQGKQSKNNQSKKDTGKKTWKPRAQVGMIIGKNDETKGYKVYLPKDRIVIATQHIKNVETWDAKQNAQLQVQLELEYPELKKAVENREGAAKRKETTGEESQSLILEKGLYGLNQSGRLWNYLLRGILVSLGFQQCYTDSCLYTKSERDGTTLVGIYVDDILVTATSENKVGRFFDDMQIVELKDLGVVSKFLGIAFHYDEEDGWALDQERVIQDMLLKFQLDKAAAVRTPIGDGQDGEETAGLLSCNGAGSPRRPTVKTCQSLVGTLLWISRCARPDISFAVHRVTRNAHAPTEADWRLAKRIAKYLKGTKELKLLMNTDENAMGDDGVLVEAFSDADHASDKKDRKSVTGGVLMVAGVVVAWLCKKQACVALSTMESEFVADCRDARYHGVS
ncbi:hypothetical protein PI125_g13359 [Phytophthora idaei]|nr:hypothetical protein PI125_g13359 [Phytophthora idaei]